MLKYIIGKITMHEEETIVVENQNIGYEVYVANINEFTIDSTVKVYLHNHIREDANLLFGFANLDQLKLFEKLITVKGIGPKIALNVLKGDVSSVINAIVNKDEKFLTSFNGIGPKAAKQMILDLSNKINATVATSSTNVVSNLEQYNLAIETLTSLGITKAQIKAFESEIKGFETEAEMVKYVLANRGM